MSVTFFVAFAFPPFAYSSAICFARPFLVFGGSLSFGETQNLYHMFGWTALSIVNFSAGIPVLVNAHHHATEPGLYTCSTVCNSNPLEIERRDVTCRHCNTVFKLLVPASSTELRKCENKETTESCSYFSPVCLLSGTKYMIMSRDQNAGRSYSMKIDSSSIEKGGRVQIFGNNVNK